MLSIGQAIKALAPAHENRPPLPYKQKKQAVSQVIGHYPHKEKKDRQPGELPVYYTMRVPRKTYLKRKKRRQLARASRKRNRHV